MLHNMLRQDLNKKSKISKIQLSQKNTVRTKEGPKHSLLPTSGFVLNEKFQRNASKFAIFYIYENPKLLFPFFISCYFIFLPNECPGLCRHRPGHSLVKKIKLLEMENEKNYLGFLIQKIWQIL